MKGIKINVKLSIKVANECSSVACISDMADNKSTCSKIIDNIFISGYRIASDYDYLVANNFTHIINCAAGSRIFRNPTFGGINYLMLDLKDDPGFDIIKAIYLTIDFIEKSQINSTGKILIHCVEGVSRGPALLAAYLMWKHSLDQDSAILLIKEKRKCVDINLGFMVQLNKWETFLHKKDETKIFKIEREGNICLLDKSDIDNLKESEINLDKFSVILMKHQNKIYKISIDDENESKNEQECDANRKDDVKMFLDLLTIYDKDHKEQEQVLSENDICEYELCRINIQLLNKKIFWGNIDEIIKLRY